MADFFGSCPGRVEAGKACGVYFIEYEPFFVCFPYIFNETPWKIYFNTHKKDAPGPNLSFFEWSGALFHFINQVERFRDFKV